MLIEKKRVHNRLSVAFNRKKSKLKSPAVALLAHVRQSKVRFGTMTQPLQSRTRMPLDKMHF